MKDILYRLVLLDIFIIGIKGRIRRLKKLIIGQRIQVKKVDHSYRIRLRLSK